MTQTTQPDPDDEPELTVDDLEVGQHVMYETDPGLGMTHGAYVEELPPWRDAVDHQSPYGVHIAGTMHDDDGMILLRRPDGRVARVTADRIAQADTDIEPKEPNENGRIPVSGL